MSNGIVWVIDDDKSIRWVLERTLLKVEVEVVTFTNAPAALAQLAQLDTTPPSVIVTDIRMPQMDGLTLLEQLRHLHPDIPVIIMTAYSDLESTVSAYQKGAFEYLPKPFDVDEAVELICRAMQRVSHAPPSESTIHPSEIIGTATAMQDVFRAIGRLSRSHITVLITGESGTGKELVARALHRHSPRTDQPFIALNTAAIPKELLESELFGHERGAFTGALQQRRGRFEQADGGTLFLDEIGDMPPELQTRLLRVLADGTFFRVGGYHSIKVNVRIIAATHQNLEQRVQAGLFREDLYHRINVIRIHLPSLRKRCEDIPALARHFLMAAANELAVESKTLHPDTERYLMQLHWSGNVRQLENTCRWLTVMASGQEILLEDLPPELRAQVSDENSVEWQHSLQRWAEQRLAVGVEDLLGEVIPKIEMVMIQAALKHTGGHRQNAAKLLGWGRNTLTRKIKELGMDDDEN
jgi:two-component system nitrogen regulation response regulator GlnG